MVRQRAERGPDPAEKGKRGRVAGGAVAGTEEEAERRRAAYERADAVVWADRELALLDQRRLPEEVAYLMHHDAPAVAGAIRDMVVRGAPAIGVAAAYGVVLSVRQHLGPRRAGDRPSSRRGRGRGRGAAEKRDQRPPPGLREAVETDLKRLEQARPTAVNLGWALARMRACLERNLSGAGVCASELCERVLREARAIHDEDVAANRRMGELGASFIPPSSTVLTHCNAGALATAGFGTALGVIRTAHREGRIERVLAGETRPWLQGSRLTAWELARAGIPVEVIADSAGAYAMQLGRIAWVIVGADRVAGNGDVANKIGTYALAVAARHHGVGFMVVAPSSTLDPSLRSGAEIPIEARAPGEVLSFAGHRVAAGGAQAWNPVFDVTPAALIDILVTEKGVLERPSGAAIRRLLG